MNTVERFLNYVAYPTMSDETSETTPSTEKQWALARAIARELSDLGMTVEISAYGYVYGALPAKGAGMENRPVIGLIAHMDTSDACADSPIRPREVLYTGEDIVLNAEEHIVLSERDYPNLAPYKGKHLIVTDGKTLLGADDKAGMAEIVSALAALISSGDDHGPIRVAFTPDEEIGQGADHFDVALFGADFAYTVDGGTLGGIEYENFNAASARITVAGKSIHPGSAKNMMINAARLVCEVQAALPPMETPEHTEGYEGFFHLIGMEGDCEHASAAYIIRDHDRARFEERKQIMEAAVARVNRRWGGEYVQLTLTDSYYNMKEVLEDKMEIVTLAEDAMRAMGVTPFRTPIRGGTDGARLSFMGLPCPNLSTGGENYHSRFEFACIEDMETMTEILRKLITPA